MISKRLILLLYVLHILLGYHLTVQPKVKIEDHSVPVRRSQRTLMKGKGSADADETVQLNGKDLFVIFLKVDWSGTANANKFNSLVPTERFTVEFYKYYFNEYKFYVPQVTRHYGIVPISFPKSWESKVLKSKGINVRIVPHGSDASLAKAPKRLTIKIEEGNNEKGNDKINLFTIKYTNDHTFLFHYNENQEIAKLDEDEFPSGIFPTEFIAPRRLLHFRLNIPGIMNVKKFKVDCFPDNKFAQLAKQIHPESLAFAKKKRHRFRYEYEGQICPDDMYSLYFEAKMSKGAHLTTRKQTIYFQCDEAINENDKNEYIITERTNLIEQGESENTDNKNDPADSRLRLNIVENSQFKCELVKEGEREEGTEEESSSESEKSPSHTNSKESEGHDESYSEGHETFGSDSYNTENSEPDGGSEGSADLNDDSFGGPSWEWEPSKSSAPAENHNSGNEADYETLIETPKPSQRSEWQESEYSSDPMDYTESDNSAGYDPAMRKFDHYASELDKGKAKLPEENFIAGGPVPSDSQKAFTSVAVNSLHSIGFASLAKGHGPDSELNTPIMAFKKPARPHLKFGPRYNDPILPGIKGMNTAEKHELNRQKVPAGTLNAQQGKRKHGRQKKGEEKPPTEPKKKQQKRGDKATAVRDPLFQQPTESPFYILDPALAMHEPKKSKVQGTSGYKTP